MIRLESNHEAKKRKALLDYQVILYLMKKYMLTLFYEYVILVFSLPHRKKGKEQKRWNFCFFMLYYYLSFLFVCLFQFSTLFNYLYVLFQLSTMDFIGDIDLVGLLSVVLFYLLILGVGMWAARKKSNVEGVSEEVEMDR